MLCKLAKVLVLTTALSGLCPATQANTTAGNMPSAVMLAQASQSDTASRLTQDDIVLPPDDTPDTAATPTDPSIAKHAAPIRIALLLPLRSSTLAAAADAVRAGVQAAYEREKDGISISMIETDGTTQDALARYADAVARYDIVVGPLARSEVTAIAQSGMVSKPTIALAQPDMSGDVETTLPPQMLAMGLSIEDEARQVANSISADKMMSKTFIISTNVAWQRRTAKAFATQWRLLGLESRSMELAVSDGYLGASSLVQLKKRMQAENPTLVFVALDAGLTAQLRLAIGADIAIYGTSQLNPRALPDWQTAERLPDMDGIRLLDIPWQLQPDHPAVMIYPRPVVGADQVRSADMARLYALGIDAYRVAREIASSHTRFQLDGVTGKLTIDFSKGATRFERIEQAAMYQDGVIVPLTSAP